MVTVGVLAVWLGLQPWGKWPGLPADTSHRLTLLGCAVALGLTHCARDAWMHPLPRAWVGWIVGLVGIMVLQQWPVMRDAAYFQWFQETAAFSDGLLVLLGVSWGLWAARQLPVTWFRRLR